jgi:hypothetical protein
MQIKLTIVFVAAGLALASFPAVAADMPADGTKNFSAPTDTPSYFTNETVPESARVDHPVPFTSEDVAAAPEVGPAYPSASEPGWHGKHGYAHKYSKHASGRSRGHGGSGHYGKATSSRPTRTAALRKPTAGGSGSASGTGKSGAQAGASKMNTTKHARTGSRQHATAAPAAGSTRTSVS